MSQTPPVKRNGSGRRAHSSARSPALTWQRHPSSLPAQVPDDAPLIAPAAQAPAAQAPAAQAPALFTVTLWSGRDVAQHVLPLPLATAADAATAYKGLASAVVRAAYEESTGRLGLLARDFDDRAKDACTSQSELSYRESSAATLWRDALSVAAVARAVLPCKESPIERVCRLLYDASKPVVNHTPPAPIEGLAALMSDADVPSVARRYLVDLVDHGEAALDMYPTGEAFPGEALMELHKFYGFRQRNQARTARGLVRNLVASWIGNGSTANGAVRSLCFTCGALAVAHGQLTVALHNGGWHGVALTPHLLLALLASLEACCDRGDEPQAEPAAKKARKDGSGTAAADDAADTALCTAAAVAELAALLA
jgi:hypothetical protein